MPLQHRDGEFLLEVHPAQGAWFWHLANASSKRAIVGAARNADEASREVSATLSEIGLRGRSAEIVPAMFKAAVGWDSIFHEFGHAASQCLSL